VRSPKVLVKGEKTVRTNSGNWTKTLQLFECLGSPGIFRHSLFLDAPDPRRRVSPCALPLPPTVLRRPCTLCLLAAHAIGRTRGPGFARHCRGACGEGRVLRARKLVEPAASRRKTREGSKKLSVTPVCVTGPAPRVDASPLATVPGLTTPGRGARRACRENRYRHGIRGAHRCSRKGARLLEACFECVCVLAGREKCLCPSRCAQVPSCHVHLPNTRTPFPAPARCVKHALMGICKPPASPPHAPFTLHTCPSFLCPCRF
jgi:hypothetical protein